jgi:ABC-type methionine transport system permease subunit
VDRALYVAGSVPFVALGLTHVVLTLMDIVSRPRHFAPRDRDLIAGMKASTLALTKATTMWNAWLGFNLSHGLGVLLFGLGGLYVSALHFDRFAADMRAVLYAMPVTALLYYLMSVRYWFRVPTIGTAAGAVLLTVGAVVMTLP